MNNEEMKKKYDSGNYIALSKWKQNNPNSLGFSEMFQINEFPEFSDGTGDYMLIHKKHEKILNAWFLDVDDVEIVYYLHGYQKVIVNNFIEGYDEDLDYELKIKAQNITENELKQAIDKQVDEVNSLESWGFENRSGTKIYFSNVNSTSNKIYVFGVVECETLPCHWDEDGECYSSYNQVRCSDHDLTPLKTFITYYNKTANEFIVFKRNDRISLNKDHWKLATDAEINLLKGGK